MPFLTINGWEIPAEEVTEESENIGGSTRTLGGNLIGNYLRKRKWRVTTTIMHPEDAKTLKLILTSAGDHWGFDNLANISVWDRTINNFWTSDKGLVPLQGTSTYRPREGPNNLNAAALEKEITNILPNQDTASFESGYGDWTRYFEILSPSNESRVADAYHGSYSYRLTGSSAGGTKKFGMETGFITGLNAGEPISFSWYEIHNISLTSVSGSGNFAPPAIVFYDDSDNEVSRVSLTNLGPATSMWHRHSISTTVPTGATKCKVRYGFENSNFASTHRIRLDAFQLEKKSVPTSFAYLTRSSDTTIHLPASHLYSKRELSFLISILVEEKITSSYYLVYLYISGWSLYVFSIYWTPSNLYANFNTPDVTNLYTLVPNYQQNIWYNIGVSFSSSKIICYVNGEKKVDTTTGYELWHAANATLKLLSTHQSFLVSNMLMLPYAVSESFLAQATSSNVYYKMPYVTISGDMVNNETIYCFPEVEDTEYIYYSHAGDWTKGEKISFTLTEV